MNRENRCIAGCLSLLLVLLFLPLAPIYAQEARGTIFGRVADPSGAAIPGAQVTVRNVATGIVQTYRTTSTGDYSAVNVNPGTYEVTASMPGFKTSSSSGLIVQVDQTLRQDFKLQVGSVSQTVNVTAESQMIQAGDATVGQVITEQQIAALPLTGRNFTNLITLAAGVSTADGGIQNSVFAPQGLNTQFTSTSINGARPASISYIVDSFTDTDFFFAKPTNVPSADAIQEFKLQNGLYSAQYGFGSAQVNVAIKSGTNQIHGTGYDFIQNSAFEPKSPLAAFTAQIHNQPKPTKAPHLVQNEFGGNLGGPFLIPKLYNGRNRSFWFFDYDGGRKRTTSSLATLQVPSLKERTGDFSDWPYPIYDPSTTGTLPPTVADPSGRVPFPNNHIPAIDPIAKNLLAYYPLPNTTCSMPCTNLSGFLPINVDTDVYTGRFDQHLGERNQMWVTVNRGDITQPTPSFFPASSTEVTSDASLVGGHYLRTFTNNLVGDFRVGYSSLKFHNGASSSFGPDLSQLLGLKNTVNIPAYYGIPVVTLGSQYNLAGTSNNGYTQTDNIYEYGANITYIRGPHTLNMGVDWRTLAIRDQDGFGVNGGLNFTGAYTASDPVAGSSGVPGPTAGNAFADLLLGDPLAVSAPAPLGSDDFDLRANEYAFYVQDDYHASSRLTVNLGLRYEQPAHFHSVNDSGSILNLDTPGGGVKYASQSFVNSVNAPANIANTYFQCCAPNTLTANRGIKFLPRIGFALSLFDSNRAVLRGGYGIYSDIYMRFYDGTDYDNNNLQLLTANPNYPVASGAEKTSPLALNTLWLPPVPLNPAAGTFPLPWQYAIATPWPLNKHPYTQQWGLDIQYALTPNTLIDVGYVGSR
ncbi:MAG: TonB-dependent receptor [Acidobacteriaceae bacterium]